MVDWCVRNPRTVVSIALMAVLTGLICQRRLSRDAVPDVSDPQIVLFGDWMGHPAPEVASQVTQVLTDALQDVPGVTNVRGASMTGMAYVDVVFGSVSRLEAGRRAIADRVESLRAQLPGNLRLQIGPLASSTGWIFQYALHVEHTGHPQHSGISLSRLQSDLLRPTLLTVPGVVEVGTVGDTVREIMVDVDPDQLRTRGVALSDVISALDPETRGPDPNRFTSLPVSKALGSASPRVGDVGKVSIATDMPTGIADLNGEERVLGGIVVAKRDADPGAIIAGVKRALAQLAPRLPPGVNVVTVYDRTDLAGRVEHTLLRALTEEIAVVVLVILIFLMDARSALIPLITLPLVLLLTFVGMWMLGVSATVMSLGGIAIALGMAVDADVVALEACHRRLEGVGTHATEERRSALLAAAASFAPAILTALLITALSFLPVFAFTGESGRLLRPLALTKTLVILSAALVTLTVAPALRDRLLRGRVRPEFDNPLTRWLVRLYRPFVQFALRQPVLTLTTAALAVASCLPILGQLGGEFLPRVDEGDLLYMPSTLPGVPPGEAAVGLRRMDLAISQFKEVANVFGKVGRSDTATDPAPYSMVETTVRLRPRSEWPTYPRQRWYSDWAPGALARVLRLAWPDRTPLTMAELVEKLDGATRLPGWTGTWTAPARARMDMMSTGGVRTPVGIRVVATSPARLDALGTALHDWAAELPGTRSVVFESLGGETRLQFDADPAALALHHVDPALVASTADLMLNGGQLGQVVKVEKQEAPPEGAPDFDARAALAHPFRHGTHGMAGALVLKDQSRPYRVRVATDMSMNAPSAGQLREFTVRSSDGRQPVPLALLGRPSYVVKPAMLRTERGELVAYLYVDLNPGTDVASYVQHAQADLARAQSSGRLSFLPGERIEWTGQFELMAAVERRLHWIVPLVGLSMLVLLYLQFRSLTEALIVLCSVPFALVGSFWTLFLLHYPLSAPVWVGLLSTVGLAMQTGVVMVVYIDHAFRKRVHEGRLNSRDDIVEAHAEGTVLRLRPKLMTIATMGASLLPLLWADGAGAEIMKRVAAPMIGGLATSAFLTLEVLPVLYTIWRYRQLRQAQRIATPIAEIIGAAPAWARA
jgi:Cu(I)/Ag(I) efflux system membrane protein CusA/SilA